MERKEVKQKLASVQEAIKKAKANYEEPLFRTSSKFIPGSGSVADIETINDLVVCYSRIKKRFTKGDLQLAVEELGITPKELGESDDAVSFLGFTEAQWKKDFESKLSDLRYNERLGKLLKAEEALLRNLSDDDKFELDMEFVASLDLV